jgi:hypothetical protein
MRKLTLPSIAQPAKMRGGLAIVGDSALAKERPLLPKSDWFLFKDIRRRPLQDAAWIPLRAIEHYINEKTFGEVGYLRDTFACGSLAVPLEHRAVAEKLSWSEIGVGHETRSYADEKGYKPADQYWLNWSSRDAVAVELVITQSFGWEDTVWHLNVDIIAALELRQEGDVWVKPDEAYVEVVRLQREAGGKPIKLEMRTEHLRDYLVERA